jgi:ParB family chromosome partitioning protein
MVRYDYATMADYGRVYPGPIEPDEAAQKRIDEITAELEKLQLEMEDEGLEEDAYNALYERVDALEEEARDLQEAYSAEDLARSGVIASWQGGQITLHVGLVRPEDAVKEEGARGASASPTGEKPRTPAKSPIQPHWLRTSRPSGPWPLAPQWRCIRRPRSI